MKKKHKKKKFMVPRGSLIISFQTTFHCYIEEEKKKIQIPHQTRLFCYTGYRLFSPIVK